MAVPIDISWDLAPLEGKPVTLDAAGGATFSGTGDAGRLYLRTKKNDFHASSFVAEVSVTLHGGGGPGCAFVGMGTGIPDAGGFNEPRTAPANYLRLAPSDFNSGGITLHNNSSVAAVTSSGPGNGNHRIRLIWDASTRRLQTMVDHNHAGRVFIRDSGLLNFSNTTGFAAGNSRLFIGGAGGVSFGPLTVRTATAGDIASMDYTVARWMSALPGSLRLSQLSIPGTHNSAARKEPVSGTAKCQNLSIAEQLAAGVRYFDARCRHIGDSFSMHHGSVYQDLRFGEVLEPVYSFLSANPNECVMMVVKEEHTPEGNTRTFAETFQSYVAGNPTRWWLGTSVPTLDEARGKIVLIRRFGGYNGGINATNWPDNTSFDVNNLVVEDHYVVPNNDTKWGYVTDRLAASAAETNTNRLYLTHSSGYRSGLFGIPSITTVSNNINPRINTWFTNRAQGRYGCLIMDFVDNTRAGLVLATNFNPQGPVPDGIYQLVCKHSGKALEISDASTATGAAAGQRTWTGGNHQRFTFTNRGQGEYRIAPLHSNMFLDVEGVSTADGARIHQWSWTGAANQIWTLVHNSDDDSFRIVSKNSGRVMEVDASSTADGARIQQRTWSGGANQRWFIQAVNRPPVFNPNPPPPVIRQRGQALSGSVSATDPDPGHSEIGYLKTAGPSWLSVSPAGALSGTPPAGTAGTFTAKVLADDPLGAVASTDLTVVVLPAGASAPLWTNPFGGAWTQSSNWLSGTIANGSAALGNFSALDLLDHAVVTLGSARSIGGLRFADLAASHDWTLAPGTGGSLTLTSTTGAPVVEVVNRTATISAVVSGNQGLVKTGAGTLVLTGAHTFTGTTAVQAGALHVHGSLASGSSIMVAAGATLGGSGTLAGPVTSHGTLSPGAGGVGTLACQASVTLAPGAVMECDFANWTGAAGSGHDLLTVSSLALTATKAAPVAIRLRGSAVANFSDRTRIFTLLRTTGGISGFAADQFVVDAGGLALPPRTWRVHQSGNDLVLSHEGSNPDANANGMLDTWEILHFGNANTGQNHPDGDADGDGLANLIEYAFGTHPTAANASPLRCELVPEGSGHRLRVTMPKNPLATNLRYRVETSDNLLSSSWNELEARVESESDTEIVLLDTVTTADNGRRFLRLAWFAAWD